jgi:Flp pilus assembly pilin Flp
MLGEISSPGVALMLLRKFFEDSRGQDLIEYALMTGFVAIIAFSLIFGVARSIQVATTKLHVTETQQERHAENGTCLAGYVQHGDLCVTRSERRILAGL